GCGGAIDSKIVVFQCRADPACQRRALWCSLRQCTGGICLDLSCRCSQKITYPSLLPYIGNSFYMLIIYLGVVGACVSSDMAVCPGIPAALARQRKGEWMTRGSSTLTKGLELLRLMGNYPDGATAAVFARDSGLPFSTGYRLLNTLADTGFAQYEPQTKQYRLGLTVFELSQVTAAARGYDGRILPVLGELSEATIESCLFAVPDGTESVTVHTVDGPEFRQTTDPGDRLPLHVSSMGKAMLAAMPDQMA